MTRSALDNLGLKMFGTTFWYLSRKDASVVIENLADKVRRADPKIKKRTVQVLLDEIRITPKKGAPWERMLEIKGVHVPLTRVVLASPTGFEPVLPA